MDLRGDKRHAMGIASCRSFERLRCISNAAVEKAADYPDLLDWFTATKSRFCHDDGCSDI